MFDVKSDFDRLVCELGRRADDLIQLSAILSTLVFFIVFSRSIKIYV